MSRGRFITFEGGEGAGKSTQIVRLAGHLEVAGISILVTREPGGSQLGERVRDILLDPNSEKRSPLSETLLFSAARTDHIEHRINPALSRDTWVLCDRFSDSTRAYQGAADGVSAEVLSALELIVLGGTVPDLTILLDLPAEEGLGRARARALLESKAGGEQDHFELRDMAFHDRLRQGFLEIAEREPDRVIVFDAMATPEALDKAIWSAVAARFGVG